MKIVIETPTNESIELELLTAFKVDNNSYVIFESGKIGSMGLPIIYISKYVDKLMKVIDPNEWQNVKNYLKGIINGTNMEYIKISGKLSADEAYFTPLTLPQNSFDIIKNNYKVPGDNNSSIENLGVPEIVDTVESKVIEDIPNTSGDATIDSSSVTPTIVTPASPVIENVPKEMKAIETPIISNPEPEVNVSKNETNSKDMSINFANDKEMFLKACENMFDALVAKYQKGFVKLEAKKNELEQKEQEIEQKIKSANEHLANAQARETVANIAHDNAQKIMDISELMPAAPQDGTTTGVI